MNQWQNHLSSILEINTRSMYLNTCSNTVQTQDSGTSSAVCISCSVLYNYYLNTCSKTVQTQDSGTSSAVCISCSVLYNYYLKTCSNTVQTQDSGTSSAVCISCSIISVSSWVISADISLGIQLKSSMKYNLNCHYSRWYDDRKTLYKTYCCIVMLLNFNKTCKTRCVYGTLCHW